jgi:hypothetical protein
MVVLTAEEVTVLELECTMACGRLASIMEAVFC